MNFATTLLLCLVCSVFAFKVTKDRRSLTDVVSMGRKYRRHSKSVLFDKVYTWLVDHASIV